MKTYFLDTRTLSRISPLVLPLDKVLKLVPREQHRHFKEVGRFKTRREVRQAVRRLQAIA